MRLTPLRSRWLQRRRPAPLVAQRAVAGPVPWVIAIMTALTVIAVAASMALGTMAQDAGAELAGGATLQIAGPPPAQAAAQAEAAMAVLTNAAEVRSARRLDRDERAALLEPWLGTAALGGEAGTLPLPEFIEFRMRTGASDQALQALRTRIAPVAPDAAISADAQWLRPIGRAIDALQWVAFALVILLATATTAAVLMASRSALAANRATIEIMHLLGAGDRQIAALFQRAAAGGAALGGGAGFALGLLIVLLLRGRFAALGPGGLPGGPSGVLGLWQWFALALIPVGGVLLAALTARFAVLLSLRRMP